MVLTLVKEDDVRYNRDRYTIKCRLCGSYKTRVRVNGEPIWIKDKNSRGEWTNHFICYSCTYEIDKVCCKCGRDTYNCIRYYNNNGMWSGNFICDYCTSKDVDEYRNRRIRLRIGYGNGSVGDTIISKILEIPACSIYAGDLKLPFGLINGYYGIIGVKISSLRKGKWDFCSNGRISADTYFYLGFSSDYKNIEIVYIIPSDIMHSNGRFCASRNSTKYLKYKVDNTPYNDVYHGMNINIENEK